MPCKKCETTLLLGIDGEIKKFCPNCEGIGIIDKKESLSFIGGNLISSNKRKIETIFKKYDKKSIIGSLVVNRELEPLAGKYSAPFHSGHFLATNLALWYAFKFNQFGNKKIKSPYEEDYQNILYLAREIVEYNNFIYLISAKFGVLVEIPKDKDFFKYRGVKNVLPESIGETAESLKQKISGRRIFKFTEKWEPILHDYKKFGLSTEVEVYEHEQKKRIKERKIEFLRKRTKIQFRNEIKTKKHKQKKDPLQHILSILNLLELGDLSNTYIRFDKLRDDTEYYVGLLKVLSSWAVRFLEKTEYEPLETKTATLKPANTQDLFDFFRHFAEPTDIPIFFKKLTSNYDNFSKFPLIVKLDEDEFLVPPYTLYFIANYLTFKHLSKEKINQLKTLEGYGFERIVSKKLTDIGVTVNHENYQDDPKNPTLEIDIIAHYKDVIFVIECKSWPLADNFLSLKEESRRQKELNEEVTKQEKRLGYVRKNMSILGFDENKIRDVKSIIITKLYEQIHEINNSIVLPFDRIEELLKF
ncbi:MAG: nuclease-related domain-containing protein [Candidatus Hodarchaeota archaeon]